MIFQTTYSIMINFLFCTVLSPGVCKDDQTHKVDDFVNLIQFFLITLYSVLVGIKVVRNYFLNNSKLNDQLFRIHSFQPKSL